MTQQGLRPARNDWRKGEGDVLKKLICVGKTVGKESFQERPRDMLIRFDQIPPALSQEPLPMRRETCQQSHEQHDRQDMFLL